MNLTTIQVRQETKKRLDRRKEYPRETYDEVIQKILEEDEIPSMKEMFRLCDQMKQDKIYSTEEVIALTHRWRHNK